MLLLDRILWQSCPVTPTSSLVVPVPQGEGGEPRTKPSAGLRFQRLCLVGDFPIWTRWQMARFLAGSDLVCFWFRQPSPALASGVQLSFIPRSHWVKALTPGTPSTSAAFTPARCAVSTFASCREGRAISWAWAAPRPHVPGCRFLGLSLVVNRRGAKRPGVHAGPPGPAGTQGCIVVRAC